MPVHRNACGSMVEDIASHIVVVATVGAGESPPVSLLDRCIRRRRLSKALLEWHDPKAMQRRSTSGWEESAAAACDDVALLS